jgi:hypothetical protein
VRFFAERALNENQHAAPTVPGTMRPVH